MTFDIGSACQSHPHPVLFCTTHPKYFLTEKKKKKNDCCAFRPATQEKCRKHSHSSKAQNNKETFNSKGSVKLL